METLRHLVFCIDKLFQRPVIGEMNFHAIGLANTGSHDVGWPGVDRDANPTLVEALVVRADQGRRFATYLDTATAGDLERLIE